MLKKILYPLLITATIATTSITNANASKNCMPIGGAGLPNFVPQSDGTITIVAPLTGSVSNATGKITSQRKTSSGLEMDMEHYFMTKKGGFMHTNDLGILTKVPGTKERYMIEISYHVLADSTSGALKGYKGNFKSFGVVDLEKLNGIIRYSGEICK